VRLEEQEIPVLAPHNLEVHFMHQPTVAALHKVSPHPWLHPFTIFYLMVSHLVGISISGRSPVLLVR
jgi:hypothetical protein